MIKTTLITLMSVGAVGTGTAAVSPQTLELAAGTMRLTAGTDGIKTQLAERSEFAVAVRTQSGRAFTIRF